MTEHTFQVGQTYSMTSGPAAWTYRVTKRTAKFITLQDVRDGSTRRVGVRSWSGVEMALPLGSYSMAPGISADRPTRDMANELARAFSYQD